MSNSTYKFTPQQKKILLTAWKTKSGKQKASDYLDAIEPNVAKYLNPYLWSGMSAKEVLEEQQEIKKLAKSLRRRLLALPDRQRISMNYGFRFEYRRRKVLPVSQNENVVDLLSRQLEAVERTCRSGITEAKKWVRRGPRKEAEYRLLNELAYLHKQHFGRLPSASPNGQFVRFLGLLSDVAGERLGPDLLKRALEDQFL